jgi:hypothetical protein
VGKQVKKAVSNYLEKKEPKKEKLAVIHLSKAYKEKVPVKKPRKVIALTD